MNPDLLWVLGLLAGAVTLFIIGKPRMDVVALLVLVALPLTGVLDLQQTLAGFSDANVILIAALFVIGDGLVRTGIAYRLGDWLVAKAGSSETRLLILLMLAVAGLGSVMSSTGVVAIFIPVVLGVAARLRIAPARLMMPLAFAGLISGMLTLVATPPNLVVHAELRRAGLDGFGFFDLTPIGLAVLLLGIGYMLIARRWLERKEAGEGGEPPRLTLADLAERYRLGERERRLQVRADSPLANQVLNELQLRRDHGINVIAIERRQRLRTLLLMASGNTLLEPGDVLLVDIASPAIGLLGSYQALGLEPMPLPIRISACTPMNWALPKWRCRRSRSYPARPFRNWAFARGTSSTWSACAARARRWRACWSTRSSKPPIPCWWPDPGATFTACKG